MAIVIDLKLDGQSKVSGGLSRVGNQLDRLGMKVDTLVAKLGSIGAVRVNGTVQGLNQISSAANGAAAAVARIKAPPIMKQGPFAALQQATATYQAKAANGTATQDDLYALRIAQRRAKNAQGAINGPGDPMSAMIAASRVAIGPNGRLQIMPLMRHLTAAGGANGLLNFAGGAAGAEGGAMAGIGAIAGPIALAIGAVTAFAGTVKHAMESIKENTSAYYAGGGSIAQAAQLSRLGAALGMSPGQAAGKARGVGDTISGNGYAMAYAASLGIDTRGGIYGNINDSDKYQKVIRDLSDPGKHSLDEARRLSRALGIDDEVSQLRFASPEMRKRALDQQGKELSPNEMKDNANAAISVNLALRDMSDNLTRLGKEALPGVTMLFANISDAALGIGKAFDSLPSWVQELAKHAAFGIGGVDWGKGSHKDAMQEAIHSNSRELQRNTRAVEASTQRTIGGGPRFNRAVPHGFTGATFHNNTYDALSRDLGVL